MSSYVHHIIDGGKVCLIHFTSFLPNACMGLLIVVYQRPTLSKTEMLNTGKSGKNVEDLPALHFCFFNDLHLRQLCLGSYESLDV